MTSLTFFPDKDFFDVQKSLEISQLVSRLDFREDRFFYLLFSFSWKSIQLIIFLIMIQEVTTHWLLLH